MIDDHVVTRGEAIPPERKITGTPAVQESAFQWIPVKEPGHEDPLSLLHTAVLLVTSGCDFEFKTSEVLLGFVRKQSKDLTFRLPDQQLSSWTGHRKM